MDVMAIVAESVAEGFMKFYEDLMFFQDIHMYYKESRCPLAILRRTEKVIHKDVA